MALSLPSKHTINVDIPEVKQFTAKFVYRFFTPDEKVNASGVINAEFLKDKEPQDFDKSIVNTVDFQRNAARFVRFNWTKGHSNRITNGNISIAQNFDKIHNEQAFLSDNYTNVFIQNPNLEAKLKRFIQQAIDTYKQTVDVPEQLGNIEKLRFLKQNLPQDMQDEFLTKAFMDLTENGHLSLTPELNEVITKTSFIRQIQNTRSSIQVNNKFLGRMLGSIQRIPTIVDSSELTEVLQKAQAKQDNSISNNNSSMLDAEDYEFGILDYINVRKIDTSSFQPKMQIMGYIIDKSEVLDDGNVRELDPIIVENPITDTTVDFEVKYDARYEYTIRTIAALETQVQNDETNEVVALTYLVSSMPSPTVVVDCFEDVPPPTPADFRVDYDFNNDAARLLWSFPVNSQRDIKGFQVFRRKSIDEPFELIHLYDFDDSEIVSPYNEDPDPALIEVVEQPKSYYLDKEFNVDSRFIYAVASVDAHGLSSNYSNQFECSFDRLKFKMKVKEISRDGAPKPYPNALLLQDTFVDTIKTSGHDRVHVYFNPETLELTDGNEDIEFLKSKYKLQLINIDNQQEQDITLNVEDKRSTQNRVNKKKRL